MLNNANRRAIGNYYEVLALKTLLKDGLQLLARNSQSRLGEIDLVMRDNKCIVFIEVRYRRNYAFGGALQSVTLLKQQKIIKAAYLWMQQQGLESENCEFRFDIFAITGKQYQWIKNAFINSL
ncbi:YraN family protein [Orbaceae bacterium ac157xtp]